MGACCGGGAVPTESQQETHVDGSKFVCYNLYNHSCPHLLNIHYHTKGHCESIHVYNVE